MESTELVVYDEPSNCSYLPDRTARLPHRLPSKRLTPAEFDDRLAAGDRRSGVFLYRTACAECSACEPIRLDMTRFQPNATQRRIQRRGNALLEVRIAAPAIDQARVELFNMHRTLRGLDHRDRPITADSYDQFLTDSCCETREIGYFLEGHLVAIAITDVGQTSLSAVYTFFNPQFQFLSLGVYSVLWQADLCRRTQRRFLYLGFYIAESPHMSYKSRFHPHQRRVGGAWRDYE